MLDETTESTSPSQELTDQQMDDLVDRAEKPSNREIPMTADEQAKNQPNQETQKPQAQDDLNFEFKHNGKTVKATREQMIKYAQQGYNYPQLMQKFNQEKTSWETQRKQSEQQYAEYQQIDQWAKQNPQSWQNLQTLYRQMMSGQITQGQYQAQAAQQMQQSPYAQLPPEVIQEFSEVKSYVQQQKTAAEDKDLDQEIQSIRGKHKDLDWNSLDENGKSLETRVLEHATEIGTKKFSVAFKDLLHEELLERAQAQAKQQVAKGIQQKTRLGLLGESPTPKRAMSLAKDPKNKSYEDLSREGLEELRAGLL